MTNIAYPYPNLSPWIENKSSWQYSINRGDFKNFDEGVEDWDYYSNLEIKCQLSWEIRDIFIKANLQSIIPNSKIIILLMSGPGKYGVKRNKIFERQLNEDLEINNVIKFNLDSNQISNNIKMRLMICTNQVNVNNFDYKNGSILYEESSYLELEGNLARLSTRIEDLKEVDSKYENALWYIFFRADNLYETFTTTCQVILNSKNKDIDIKLRNDLNLVHAIRADTIATVMRAVLLSDDNEMFFEYEEEYPEYSLGYVIKSWLKYFIDRKSELENLKVRMKEKPGDFSCECQSIFKD